MPWKERSIVEERMRFVLRLKDGESMASLCTLSSTERSDHPFTKRSGDMVYTSGVD